MRVIKQFVVFICLCLQCLAAGEDGAQPAVATVGGREGETLLRRVDTVHQAVAVRDNLHRTHFLVRSRLGLGYVTINFVLSLCFLLLLWIGFCVIV